MLLDRYAFSHTSKSDAAARSFESAIEAVLSHRPAATALEATLDADPDHLGALALRGLAAVLSGCAPSQPMARAMTDRTRGRSGTPSEVALVEALASASQGHLAAAAARLEAHLANHRQDVLAAKLAHALRFMSGDPHAMLATTTLILPHLDPNSPGYGFMLGCHAFSLEETGHFTEADAAGRAAVELVPHDVWALHAVAHVMEMRGRARDGIAWLEPTRVLWPSCSIFGGHLAWHLALFHLSTASAAEALTIFDTYLSAPVAGDFRDLANAASLLWRIEQERIDVGDRWDRIADLALVRGQDTTYVFGTLHTLLTLIGSRQFDAARETVEALRLSAFGATADQSRVARDVGYELAQSILAMAEHQPLPIPLASLGARLQQIGGSIAQRDVFLRTLLLMAADAGDEIGTAKLSALRLSQRQEDRFTALLDRRFRHARSSCSFERLTASA